MQIEQLLYKNGSFDRPSLLGDQADWLLVFGSRMLVETKEVFDELRLRYPKAYIMGCSTAGEMNESYVSENGLCATAVHFEKAQVHFLENSFLDDADFFDVGQELLQNLETKNLRHVFLLADGLKVNGSTLISGFNCALPEGVTVSGGLAADNSRYKKTLLYANDYAKENRIVCAAFYGDIRISAAAATGWKAFGIERLVSKAEGRTLYELDGKPALDLYKEYLGESAKDLPKSGVRFPLSFRHENCEHSFMRSLQAIDENTKSMLFFGDIPQGSYCRLTHSNPYNLIDGAREAAKLSLAKLAEKPQLAIPISCRGRQFILRQMTEEELEVIQDVFEDDITITGFYSYGELMCQKMIRSCEMHNQTMTVTLFAE